MLKTLEATERTEMGKPWASLEREWGQHPGPADGASSFYRRVAALASALGRIERELGDSQAWLHDGLCDCAQCLFELRRQRQLIEARNRLLAELDALNAAVAHADVDVECVRCCQPFVPVDDEQALRSDVGLRKMGPVAKTAGPPTYKVKGVSKMRMREWDCGIYNTQGEFGRITVTGAQRMGALT
jgi:hypothetical protein